MSPDALDEPRLATLLPPPPRCRLLDDVNDALPEGLDFVDLRERVDLCDLPDRLERPLNDSKSAAGERGPSVSSTVPNSQGLFEIAVDELEFTEIVSA